MTGRARRVRRARVIPRLPPGKHRQRVHTVAAVQASNRFPFPTPHIPLPPTAELALYEADVDYGELEFNSV